MILISNAKGSCLENVKCLHVRVRVRNFNCKTSNLENNMTCNPISQHDIGRSVDVYGLVLARDSSIPTTHSPF
jgi:hypothetical protein